MNHLYLLHTSHLGKPYTSQYVFSTHRNKAGSFPQRPGSIASRVIPKIEKNST